MELQPSDAPEFDAPPINEIVIGVSFQRPPSLTIAHLGLFWASIKEEFPAAEEHGPIGDIASFPMVDGLPLPRLWFIEKSENKLLQLQLDRMYLNWRRRRPDDQYPRFGALKQQFQEYWSRFCTFAGDIVEHPIVLTGAELTKINHFPQGAGWEDISEVNSILRTASSPESLGSVDLTYIGYKCALKHEELNVNIELKTGKLKDGTDRGVFTLELKAHPEVKGLLANQSELLEKFEKANDSVNLLFTSITTNTAQRNVWGRKI